MTLSPQEIAALDQVEAQWSEWFGKLGNTDIRRLLDDAEAVVKRGHKIANDQYRPTIHQIFLIGLHRLQVVAQTGKEMQ